MATDPKDVLEHERCLDDVLTAYLAAVDAGQRPNRGELLACHPDLAAELGEFFAAQDRFDRWAEPLREFVQAPQDEALTRAERTGDGGDTAITVPGPVGGFVGDYELLKQIGRGGMGVVYAARQQRLKRVVALKMLSAGPHADPQDLARFRIEGEAIARLRHPHVVQIYEFGEHDRQPYFSMELMEGGSLAARLAGKPLPPRESAQMLEALADGVHAAHLQQTIHRDLKPANVLLTADGVPKISDFGLAKLIDTEGAYTRSDAIVGTPNYMAPEQARGDSKSVGPLVDVYALGAILYEVLTGRAPFKAATRLETLEQVRRGEPVPPSRVQRNIPRDLEAICLKCLEKDPGRRYAAAEGLARDLGRWLRGEPTVARPARWPARLWRSARRHSTISLVVLLAALAAVIGLVVAVYTDRDRPARAIERRLASGEAVTLIGPTGEPKWYRWEVGGDAAQISTANDGTFAIHSWSLSLLELVRDPQAGHYRIRAEVRHDTSVEQGAVGIYFGHRVYRTPRGDLHYFGQLSFNDIADVKDEYKRLPDEIRKQTPPPRGNAVRFFAHLYGDERQGLFWEQLIYERSRAKFRPAGFAGGSWRELAVEVSPAVVRAFWQGKPVGEINLAELARQVGEHYNDMRNDRSRELSMPPLDLDLQPHGSLGLYVYRSSVSLRSVVVERVSDDQ